MEMKRALIYCLGLVAVGTVFLVRMAEAETPAAAPAPESTAAPAPAQEGDAPARKTSSTEKGKRRSEKEAEGTQAPNRFEADPVIKSRYELDGQPLEVDPD